MNNEIIKIELKKKEDQDKKVSEPEESSDECTNADHPEEIVKTSTLTRLALLMELLEEYKDKKIIISATNNGSIGFITERITKKVLTINNVVSSKTIAKYNQLNSDNAESIGIVILDIIYIK